MDGARVIELGPAAREALERIADALERIAEAADGATRAQHVLAERLRREESERAGMDDLVRRREKARAAKA